MTKTHLRSVDGFWRTLGTTSESIQSLIDVCAPLELTAYIPCNAGGNYTATGLVHDNGSLKLLGEDAGTQGTRIATTTDAAILTIAEQATVEGVGFIGSAEVGKTAQTGITINGINQVRLKNLVFDGLYTALKITGTVFYSSVEDCKFFDGPGPMVLMDGSADAGIAMQFVNVEMFPTATAGSVFDITDIGSLIMTGGVISPALKAEHSIYIRTAASLAGVSQYNSMVWEGSVKSAIRIDGTAPLPVQHQFFVNNYANQSGVYPTMLLKYVTDIQYTGGYLSGTSSAVEFVASAVARDVNFTGVRMELDTSDPAIKISAGASVKKLTLTNVALPGSNRLIDASAATASDLRHIYIDGGSQVGSNSQPVTMPSGGYAPEILNWQHGNTCRATKGGTNQTGVSTATETLVTFGTQVWDRGIYDPTTGENRGIFDPATSIITPLPGPTAFHVRARITGATADTFARLLLYKAGSLSQIGPEFKIASDGSIRLHAVFHDLVIPSDAYTIRIIGESGGTITVMGDAAETSLTVHQI